MSLTLLRKTLRSYASQERKKSNEWFFKTDKGQYGHGDKFIGVTVPDSRKVAREFRNLPLTNVKTLLQSKIHEERLTALLLLVHKFQTSEDRGKKQIYDFYLRNTNRVNNWDLVDLSASKIIGEHLLNRPKKERIILYTLARSKNLWEKRIAIISTYAFLHQGHDFVDTFKISDILLRDKHDLIHKAVGWILREVGKRDQNALEQFLGLRYKSMPRTMLRYAIERFPERKRKAYLKCID